MTCVHHVWKSTLTVYLKQFLFLIAGFVALLENRLLGVVEDCVYLT